MTIPAPTCWWKLDDGIVTFNEEMGTGIALESDSNFGSAHQLAALFGQCVWGNGNDNTYNGVLEKYVHNALVDLDCDFTWAVWCQPWPPTADPAPYLVAKRETASPYSFNYRMWIYPVGGQFGVSVYDNADNPLSAIGDWDPTVGDYKYHLFVMRYIHATGTVAGFIDGVKVTEATFGEERTLHTNANKVQLGVTRGASSTTLRGYLDNAMLWRSALSDAQIEELYFGDTAPPYVQNQDPAPSDTGVEPDSNIYLEVVDNVGGSGVDLTTVLIQINENGAGWNTAYDGSTDTFSAPYDGAASARGSVTDGYSFTIDPDPDLGADGKVVQVRVNASDLAGNPMTVTTYSFTTTTANFMVPFEWTFTTADATAPYVTNNTPTGTGVARATAIEFDITDDGIGVDPATVVVVVDGVTAYSGGSTQNGWGGAGLTGPVGKTYHMELTPPGGLHPNYSTVDIDVDADDLGAVSMPTFSWSFTTVDTVAPTIVNEDPLESSSAVPTTNVQFDVLDPDTGVVPEDIVATIEAVEAYNWDGIGVPEDGFKTGFDGPGSSVTAITNGYRIVIDPTVDFAELDTVNVEVTAQDQAAVPNVAVRSWSFDILDVSVPYVENEFPTGSLIPKETDISFDIKDAPTSGTGVDLTTVVVVVEGSVAYNWNGVGVPDDGFMPGWDGPNSAITLIADGYNFVIDKVGDLPTQTLIDVTVDASDNEVPPNVMPQFSWSFLTEVVDTDLPYVEAIRPEPNGNTDDLNAEIVFHAIDDTTGINLSTVVVTIGGETAFTGGVGQPGFQVTTNPFETVGIFGPVTQYQFKITRDQPFVLGDIIEVSVYLEDNG